MQKCRMWEQRSLHWKRQWVRLHLPGGFCWKKVPVQRRGMWLKSLFEWSQVSRFWTRYHMSLQFCLYVLLAIFFPLLMTCMLSNSTDSFFKERLSVNTDPRSAQVQNLFSLIFGSFPLRALAHKNRTLRGLKTAETLTISSPYWVINCCVLHLWNNFLSRQKMTKTHFTARHKRIQVEKPVILTQPTCPTDKARIHLFVISLLDKLFRL